MTQEEKNLLLQDLCGRLPYGVKGVEANTLCSLNTVTRFKSIVKNIEYKIENLRFKPYLYPLSSMSDEQYKEYCELEHSGDMEHLSIPLLDWCNRNHFDYRGLIPMGLALDATNLNIY